MRVDFEGTSVELGRGGAGILIVEVLGAGVLGVGMLLGIGVLGARIPGIGVLRVRVSLGIWEPGIGDISSESGKGSGIGGGVRYIGFKGLTVCFETPVTTFPIYANLRRRVYNREANKKANPTHAHSTPTACPMFNALLPYSMYLAPVII
jgi:hypothetical protein